MSARRHIYGEISVWASTSVMAEVYRRLSRFVDPGSHRLRTWLFDVSGRCSPFLDVSLLGIESEFRMALIQAAHEAVGSLASQDQNAVAAVLRELIAAVEQAKLKNPDYLKSPKAEPAEDLDQIWDRAAADVFFRE
jgi:hypothetical protein